MLCRATDRKARPGRGCGPGRRSSRGQVYALGLSPWARPRRRTRPPRVVYPRPALSLSGLEMRRPTRPHWSPCVAGVGLGAVVAALAGLLAVLTLLGPAAAQADRLLV